MQVFELEAFLYKEIPIAKAFGAKVIQADDQRAEVRAPLKLNSNHLGTAFGGSLNAILVLACYTWLFNALKDRGLHCHVVIKESQTKYLKPVDGDFSAICQAPPDPNLTKFFETMGRKQRARLVLQATIDSNSEPACTFEGEFIAQHSK